MYSDRLFYCNSYCGDRESGKGSYSVNFNGLVPVLHSGVNVRVTVRVQRYLLVPRCDYISSFHL